MYKIPEKCPSCGGELEIREVHCLQCDMEMRSHFEQNPFSRLTPQQATFLELFVQAKGNMRQLEQTLGVSYPTVRSRIEAIGARLKEGRPDAPMPLSAGGGLDQTAEGEEGVTPSPSEVLASAVEPRKRGPKRKAE